MSHLFLICATSCTKVFSECEGGAARTDRREYDSINKGALRVTDMHNCRFNLIEPATLLGRLVKKNPKNNLESKAVGRRQCSNANVSYLVTWLLGDVKGEYTFTSPRGQSTIDYFIVSAEHLSSVADMQVMRDAQYCNRSCDVPHDGQKSDHFPLQLDLACTISSNSNNARSSPSQPSTCPLFKYVESQADAYQQCLTVMHLVPLLTGTIDVDTVVAILITCMTKAAQQTLNHSSPPGHTQQVCASS